MSGSPVSTELGVRPVVVVVSGPSGTGKSTLLKRLFNEYPDRFGFSISHTTRQPRPGEQDGISYHFVAREEFVELIDRNAFIEYTQYSGNLYGTSVKAVQDVGGLGKTCILDVELNGVKAVKEKKDQLDARFLFIAPPSLEVLAGRLRGRGTETEESIATRLKIAEKEIAYAEQEGAHDLAIVNDKLDEAYEKFRNFILDTHNEKFGQPDA